MSERVIEALKGETIPWIKTWSGEGAGGHAPLSLSTNKPYRGWNYFWLSMAQGLEGYESNKWGTYNQIKKRGGQVMKGQQSTSVIYWQRKIVCACDNWYDANKPSCPKCAEPRDNGQMRFTIREYKVFNIDQAEWDDGKKPKVFVPPPREVLDEEVADEALEVVNPYIESEGVTLSHGGDRAYYRPSNDSIRMPCAKNFVSGQAYAVTLYHECIHSTGHEDRLKRKSITEKNHFGSHEYSREELVAEMGAQMMAVITGHQTETTIENAKAYCQNWAEVIKNDEKMVIQAAQQAQKAVDYIMECGE